MDHDKFGNQTKRYVMPKNEINLTIAELHNKETAGHLGVDKTLERVKSRFFWINLSRDVKKFVRECHGCQKVKPPKAYSKPKLMPLAPTRTLVLITMDMAGPLPTTKRGNKYILFLVICDHFTKFVQAYAARNDRRRSCRRCHQILFNIRYTRGCVNRRGYQLYQPTDWKPVGEIRRSHASNYCISPTSRRHHRTI